MVSGRKPDLNRRRRVAELHAEGLSLSEIGRQLGISRQTVHATLRSIQKAEQRVVICRGCKMQIDPAGVLPADADKALCLICLARGPEATFGERLKVFRLAVGLTRRELDRLANLPSGSVQDYEEDRHFPTRKNRTRLADALGVTLEVLGLGAPIAGRRERGRPKKQ
jgi:transcriptional regulator with XRE-family HTH domain